MNDTKDELIAKMIESIKESETETFNYLLPEFLSRQVATYMSMREDLIFIQEETNLLIELAEKQTDFIDKKRLKIIAPSLWYSIVATYGRCFTDASHSQKPKLEKRDCFDHSNSELEQIHDYLMFLRHNFVAHRGNSESEEVLVYLKVQKKDSSLEKTTYGMKSLKSISPSKDKLKQYLRLFAHIQTIVERKLEIQTQKVHKKFLSEFDVHTIKYLLIQ